MKRKNFLVPPKETFICLNCGRKVSGGRYVNHCPYCLWSKHVDQDVPGDRQSKCQGAMKPVGVIKKGERWRIIHRCQRCGKKTVTDTRKEDNFDLVVKLTTGLR